MSNISGFSFTYNNFGTSLARTGSLKTPHGIIKTPAFIFCATKASVKGITPKQLHDAGVQVILSNTYHLMITPGGGIINQFGGLQKMTGWKGPMLTDSGGFQIFSLNHNDMFQEIKRRCFYKNSKGLLKISEYGAIFRSYVNGLLYNLTPEKSIQIQKQLGADLVLVLDECTPFNVNKCYTKNSMEMTHRWSLRSLIEFNKINDSQALYGIIQGGVYNDLREISTYFFNKNNFFGHAIGGSLGSDKNQMYDIIAFTAEKLLKVRPIHLLGIGNIQDIFFGVQQGIDTFDCVYPTRLARHGSALIQPIDLSEYRSNNKEYINLRNTKFSLDENPISKNCHCETCNTFSKGYIHYLLKSREILALQAISIHNISFMNRMMFKIRKSIEEGILESEMKNWVFV